MTVADPLTSRAGVNDLDISVIVCTRNRAEPLRHMLDSAALLRIPADVSWELIVVDNGSSDSTAAVVAGFAERLPIRYVMEPVPGLSNARNRGAAEARGALILWTDDDVAVDREWLAAYVDASERFPDAGFFGGQVVPVLEAPVSDLFANNLDHPALAILIARRTYGEPPVRLPATDLPFGANFAVRSEWQRQHRYDPRLGVSPEHNRSGEETNFLHQIMAAGATGMSVPAAVVRHFIPAQRQSAAYVRRYFAAHGETWALVHSQPGFAMADGPMLPGRVSVAGVPSWLLRRAVRHGFFAQLAALSGDHAKWLDHVSEWEHSRAAIKYITGRRTS